MRTASTDPPWAPQGAVVLVSPCPMGLYGPCAPPPHGGSMVHVSPHPSQLVSLLHIMNMTQCFGGDPPSATPLLGGHRAMLGVPLPVTGCPPHWVWELGGIRSLHNHHHPHPHPHHCPTQSALQLVPLGGGKGERGGPAIAPQPLGHPQPLPSAPLSLRPMGAPQVAPQGLGGA